MAIKNNMVLHALKVTQFPHITGHRIFHRKTIDN